MLSHKFYRIILDEMNFDLFISFEAFQFSNISLHQNSNNTISIRSWETWMLKKKNPRIYNGYVLNMDIVGSDIWQCSQKQ
jgi:hypothetical protein